jgi:hypothetical protein
VSRILFVMLHPGFVRYYEGALHGLVAAGHEVHLAFEVSRAKLGEDETAMRLATWSPRLTCGPAPERTESVRAFLTRGDRTATRTGETPGRVTAAEAWESLATSVRLLIDYLHFFEPAFAGADGLRSRAEKRLPRLYPPIVRATARAGSLPRAALAAGLRAVERLIPTEPGVDAFLRQHDPDLLLVTPLVELGSQQVDYVKAARRLGIRSVLCVASWDNLTSKGLMRVVPDQIVVWNDAQKTEAVDLHGARPEQVLVTGAQLFDRWFDARPSRERDEFCRQVGLDASRPLLLYVGSSSFIAPDEVPFVERWLSRLARSADPRIAGIGVLIRPHPANARQWRRFDASSFPNVALWPAIGTDPNAPGFHRDYYDSLWHSAAVVGINTSAQIEAAIVGRPVLTIKAPEFAHAQEGTLHFRHLVDQGPVSVADTFDAHLTQLAACLDGSPPQTDGRRAAFVQRFIRPRGLDTPAAPVFVDAIASLCGEPRPRRQPDPWWAPVARVPAAVAARVAHALAEDRPLWIHALRPVLATAAWTLALVDGPGDGWPALVRVGVRRGRREAWRVWYESTRAVQGYGRRGRKALRRWTRPVEAVVRRATGRIR